MDMPFLTLKLTTNLNFLLFKQLEIIVNETARKSWNVPSLKYDSTSFQVFSAIEKIVDLIVA